MRQWRASFTASKPSGFTIGFMAPAPRPAEISSNISRAFTIPIACIRPWAISAQPSLSVWRPNPVHFFGGRSPYGSLCILGPLFVKVDVVPFPSALATPHHDRLLALAGRRQVAEHGSAPASRASRCLLYLGITVTHAPNFLS